MRNPHLRVYRGLRVQRPQSRAFPESGCGSSFHFTENGTGKKRRIFRFLTAAAPLLEELSGKFVSTGRAQSWPRCKALWDTWLSTQCSSTQTGTLWRRPVTFEGGENLRKSSQVEGAKSFPPDHRALRSNDVRGRPGQRCVTSPDLLPVTPT